MTQESICSMIIRSDLYKKGQNMAYDKAKSRRVTFDMTRAMRDTIDKYVSSGAYSGMSQFVREAVEEHVKRLEKKKAKQEN